MTEQRQSAKSASAPTSRALDSCPVDSLANGGRRYQDLHDALDASHKGLPIRLRAVSRVSAAGAR